MIGILPVLLLLALAAQLGAARAVSDKQLTKEIMI
jgi:hypothetical protein